MSRLLVTQILDNPITYCIPYRDLLTTGACVVAGLPIIWCCRGHFPEVTALQSTNCWVLSRGYKFDEADQDSDSLRLQFAQNPGPHSP